MRKKGQFISVVINDDIFKDKKFSMVLMCWCHLYSEYDFKKGEWAIDWPQLKKDIIKENGCEESYGMSRYKFNQAAKMLREKGVVSEDGKYIRGYQKGDIYVKMATYTLDWLCRNLDDLGLRVYLYLKNKWNLRKGMKKCSPFYRFSMKELVLAAGYKYNARLINEVKVGLGVLKEKGLIEISESLRIAKESGSYMELYRVRELDDFAPLEDIIWFRHEFYGMEWDKEDLSFAVQRVKEECRYTDQEDWKKGKHDVDKSFDEDGIILAIEDTLKGLPPHRFKELGEEEVDGCGDIPLACSDSNNNNDDAAELREEFDDDDNFPF